MDNKSTSCFGFTRGRARLGMREFLYREFLHRRSLKEDRVLEIEVLLKGRGGGGEVGH